ncbi:MAG: translation elongation factor Ts [Deltaproteobacteria bacterium]|jgi:elongation factor Ts|nr:translation elongation factor Ts [Deltaproteobacteria bacterium]
MEITSQLVKTLRDKTSAGMMDCKNALKECGGDLEKAIDWLRQKGLMTARKRADRATKEGLVLTAISADGRTGAVVELNSETDFVSKMESFREITESLAGFLATEPNTPADVDALLQCRCPKCGETFFEVVNRARGTTGENMRLRRFKVLRAAGPDGLVRGYVHSGGKIGVLVELKAGKIGPEVEELAHDLAMHVAASNPMALRVEHVSPDFVEKEKAVQQGKAQEELDEKAEKARKTGKPVPPPSPEMLAKIVEGKMRKVYTELVLHEQIFIKDQKMTVSGVIADACKKVGPVELLAFARFQLGEEVEGEKTEAE